MSYISRIVPEEFINRLTIAEANTDEVIMTFPLEYFDGGTFVFLYKQIGSKIYKTIVRNLELPITEDDNEIEIEVVRKVLWKGKEFTFNEFMDDIITNHHAIVVIEPIDYQDLLMKHYHDAHLHAHDTEFDILKNI
jgi:hypothetical protein